MRTAVTEVVRAAAQGKTITSLPWWMGVFLVLVWVGIVLAAVAIARHRWRVRHPRYETRPPTVTWDDHALPERAGPVLELPATTHRPAHASRPSDDR